MPNKTRKTVEDAGCDSPCSRSLHPSSHHLNSLDKATDESNSWAFALRGSTPPLWLSQSVLPLEQLQRARRVSHLGILPLGGTSPRLDCIKAQSPSCRPPQCATRGHQTMCRSTRTGYMLWMSKVSGPR